MATQTKPISDKMEPEMMNQIKQMGFEKYIATVHARFQLLGGLKILFYSFLMSVFIFVAPIIYQLMEEDVVIHNALLIGLRVLSVLILIGAGIVYFIFYSPAKRKAGLIAYKERLTKRHGDYKKVLNEVEEQLEPGVYKTECSTYITKDWIIIMDARRPVSFTHKTEVAGLIGTTAGTVMVWYDGEYDVDMYFGNNTWWKVFAMIAEKNPFILTNRDNFINKSGNLVSIGTTTTFFAKKGEDNGIYVAKQYASNKEAGILPVWNKSNDSN